MGSGFNARVSGTNPKHTSVLRLQPAPPTAAETRHQSRHLLSYRHAGTGLVDVRKAASLFISYAYTLVTNAVATIEATEAATSVVFFVALALQKVARVKRLGYDIRVEGRIAPRSIPVTYLIYR